MIDFEEAWQTLEVGTRVRVSDGRPQPSTNTTGLPYFEWRSHNFEGTLIDKLAGPPRVLRLEMDPEPNATVAYDVTEGTQHNFEIV